MSLSHLSLASLTAADIDSLTASSVGESREIDFKRDYSLNSDKEKKELACDVVAFANSIGGDIIFGIEEKDGKAAGVVGVNVVSEDEERLRINSILTHAIAPRLSVEVRFITTTSGKVVLVIRVAQSSQAPHMVVYNLDHRFYGRNAAQRFLLDVHQVREAFMATEQITNQIRSFRLERIQWIAHNEVEKRLPSPHIVALHLMPVNSLRAARRLSAAELRRAESADSKPMLVRYGWHSYPNLDGFRIAESETSRRELSYVQLFRNGCLEAVDTTVIFKNDNQTLIDPGYEGMIRNALPRFQKVIRNLGLTGECAVGVSLLSVKGALIGRMGGGMRSPRNGIDLDNLVLPEGIIDLTASQEETDPVLRDIFEQVWNAIGYTKSQNFDEEGKWTGVG